MTKKKNILSLILCFTVFVLEIIAGFLSYRTHGSKTLIYFTELSNIFAGIACAVLAIFIIREMKTGKQIPDWVFVYRYLSAGALALTFFTVIFVLAPIAGSAPDMTYGKSYFLYLTYGAMIVTHSLGPIIVMLSFLFLDDFKKFHVRHIFIATIPTILYEIVSITMNVLRIWDGPYPFLKVHEQPVWASCIWAVVMFGFSLGLCFCLWKIKKLIIKKI